jgi:oxygen-independent coproporphyrinogen-3 oxidase
MLKQLSIYIHYPFCEAKCGYCDFNSHVQANIDHQKFLEAYCLELDYFVKQIGRRKIKTIFFGGGTPSLMPEFLLAGILEKINQVFEVDKNCEITLEANPSSVEINKFVNFKKIGINRLSLGIQAFNTDDLKFLERVHDYNQAIKAIEVCQKNFDNFSFDLIYARPKQSIESWLEELNFALQFNTKHLSLYQLTIEKGTKFFSQYQQKKFSLPDENLASELYLTTSQIMLEHGFDNYEVSNYAQKNFQSQHNLAYWKSLEYLGIGAGAHSRITYQNEKNRRAIMMIHQPNSWLKKVFEQQNGIQTNEVIEPKILIEEILLMGLRLEQGIDIKEFEKLTKQNFYEVFNKKMLEKMQDNGLIILENQILKIPQNKWLILDMIISSIIFYDYHREI